MVTAADPTPWPTTDAFATAVAEVDQASRPGFALGAFNHMAALATLQDYDRIAGMIETMPEHWLEEPLRSRWLLAGAHAVMHSTNPIMARHRAVIDRFSATCVLPFLAEHPRLVPRRRARSRLAIGFFGSILRHPLYADRGIRAVLAAMDRQRFEVHALALGTDDLPPAAWLGADATHALGDETAAAHHLRALGLDVILYLDGVQSNMPWRLLARRAARLQVSWFHPHLTFGAIALDGQIADLDLVPLRQRQWYAEPILDLPVRGYCYALLPLYAGNPARRQPGTITFGSFNRLSKISVACATAWAQILTRLPTAQLRINSEKVHVPAQRTWLLERLEACGVPLERVALDGGQEDADFLAGYGDLDLVLDTFPFTGGMTSFEGLSQGAPILTLEGPELVQRMTAVMLRSINVPELITTSVEDYVARAVALAEAPEALAALRHGLRDRVAQSALCDVAGFADQIGDALAALAR